MFPAFWIVFGGALRGPPGRGRCPVSLGNRWLVSAVPAGLRLGLLLGESVLERGRRPLRLRPVQGRYAFGSGAASLGVGGPSAKGPSAGGRLGGRRGVGRGPVKVLLFTWLSSWSPYSQPLRSHGRHRKPIETAARKPGNALRHTWPRLNADHRMCTRGQPGSSQCCSAQVPNAHENYEKSSIY